MVLSFCVLVQSEDYYYLNLLIISEILLLLTLYFEKEQVIKSRYKKFMDKETGRFQLWKLQKELFIDKIKESHIDPEVFCEKDSSLFFINSILQEKQVKSVNCFGVIIYLGIPMFIFIFSVFSGLYLKELEGNNTDVFQGFKNISVIGVACVLFVFGLHLVIAGGIMQPIKNSRLRLLGILRTLYFEKYIVKKPKKKTKSKKAL